MAGLTAVCAGIAFFSSGVGKVALVSARSSSIVALWGFFKIKPLEGKTGSGPQPAVMKLIGVAVVLLGWLIVLFGLHLTASVGGRMVTSIVGFAISLAGILLRSGARSQQERDLEGLIALPQSPWRSSTQLMELKSDENCTHCNLDLRPGDCSDGRRSDCGSG